KNKNNPPRKAGCKDLIIYCSMLSWWSQGGRMKFKKLSNHFWRLEVKGAFHVGTWEELQEVIATC
ncbi:MAG: hypothetical protein ACRCZ2_12260, partial [Fusobacteriaceae bacterium]